MREIRVADFGSAHVHKLVTIGIPWWVRFCKVRPLVSKSRLKIEVGLKAVIATIWPILHCKNYP